MHNNISETKKDLRGQERIPTTGPCNQGPCNQCLSGPTRIEAEPSQEPLVVGCLPLQELEHMLTPRGPKEGPPHITRWVCHLFVKTAPRPGWFRWDTQCL